MIIRVLDILHSNNGKGKYRESKVGEKYENRKNKIYSVDFDDLLPWGGLEMTRVVDGEVTNGGILTTAYEGLENKDGILEIYTYNSIYVCEIIE